MSANTELALQQVVVIYFPSPLMTGIELVLNFIIDIVGPIHSFVHVLVYSF